MQKLKVMLAFVLALMAATPTWAVTERVKMPVVFTKPVTMQSTLTTTGAQTVGGAMSVTGNLAVTGTSAFTGAITATVPITNASIGNAAKRWSVPFSFAAGGTLADSTTYRTWVVPGRAGSVKRITLIAGTPTVGGTNTFKVLKGSSAGNTMLSAASFDPTGLTANQASAMTLTATSADLAVTASGANSAVYLEYAAGVQTTDAINVAGNVEFEADDY